MPSVDEIKRRLAEFADIPAELVSGAPLITIVGAGDLTIENYKSILEYSDERARFLTAKGVVSAAGKRLHLRQITRERVVISGKIEKLEFL